MAYKYDALVYIGRFQPLHFGHTAVIDEALKIAEEVIVIVGSSFAARSTRNPFSFEERKRMLRSVYPLRMASTSGLRQDSLSQVDPYGSRVKIVPVPDYPYDENKWVASIQTAVMGAIKFHPGPLNIGLIGHQKDDTSYYLKLFPMWGGEGVANYLGLNATDIRYEIFDNNVLGPLLKINRETMPDSVYDIVSELVKEPWFRTLRHEWNMVESYKKSWANAPFPPTFVTTDTVVIQSGHILLVKRGDMPGKGLWALPGGFLNQNETLLDGALRELKEETKIKVPLPVLRGSIKGQHTFDYPRRSARGRTITTAFYIDLGFDTKLPKVTGADDAEKAFWVSFRELDRAKFFEDHFHIINHFLNIG